MKGLVHIYTGEGKGKTTCSVGLALRAYGWGKKVCIIQFLKGSLSGEIKAIKALRDNITIKRLNKNFGFYYDLDNNEKKEFAKQVRNLYNIAQKAIMSNEYDMVVLDEILGTLSIGLIKENEVLMLINDKPDKTELVLTGRDAPRSLIDVSDYVSEVKSVKHPFNKNIPARKGIEF